MEAQTNLQAEIQLPQQASPAQPPVNNKSFYKNPFVYGILILIIASLAGAAYLFTTKYKLTTAKQLNSGTVKYTSGFPLDEVTVHIPDDSGISRYPLTELSVSSENVNLNTFEGLTVYRGTNLIPGLAESWTNPDPTTWRFKLRKGVKFQSGDLFTSKDIKYTIEQAIASEKDKKPWMSQPMASRIDSVKIIDDYTVELKTKEPDATLLAWLVYLGIVSKDQVARDGLEKAVGTGPYKLVSFTKNEANMDAYDDYWGGKPKVKKLTYEAISDANEAKKDLEKGKLDIISLVTTGNKDLIDKGYRYADYRTGGIIFLIPDINSEKSKYITGTDKNPLKDKRIRYAIQLALDVPKLTASAGTDAEPVSQFATPELIGFNQKLTIPRQDLAQAKNLMADAGFKDGFTLTIDGEILADQVKILGEIKKQLAVIGITVKTNVIDGDALYNKLDKGDFTMVFTSYFPDTIDSLDLIDTLFHAKGGSHGLFNMNNYSNQQVNNIIDQANSTFDVEKKIVLTKQAHALIMDDLPIIPVYTQIYQIFSTDTVSYKPSVSNFLLGFDISGRQKNK